MIGSPAMLPAPTWFIATDADKAGETAASVWPECAVRVRPPGPYKDWTDAARDEADLHRWWTDRVGDTEAPSLFTWDELSSWAWGPASGEPESGIVID